MNQTLLFRSLYLVSLILPLALVRGADEAVTLIDSGQPVIKIYHAPLSQEADPLLYKDTDDYARLTRDDPERNRNWIRGPRTFSRMELDDQQAKLLANAVLDLVYHLEKMSGAQVEVVVTEDPAAVVGPALVVGPLATALGADPSAAGEENPEAYRIVASGDRILIGGNYPVGGAYGAYALLRQLGVDWVFPGTEGEIIPERSTVKVAVQDTVSAPSFNPRAAWYGGFSRSEQAHYDFFRWLQRMKMQHRSFQFYSWSIGGHTWGRQLMRPNIEEFEANPEMLALRHMPDGSFQRRGPQVETTHPRVVEIAVEYIRGIFEQNEWENDKRVMIGMGPADGAGVSHSAESIEVGGRRFAFDSGRRDGSDLVVHFLNTILEATEEEFPNLHLGYLVYSWHADYPMIHHPHPRIGVRVADINFSRMHSVACTSSKSRAFFRDIMEQWGRLSKEQGNDLHRWYYGYGQANLYLPLSLILMYGEGLPFDHEVGVTGVTFNLYNNWEVTGASNYIMARLCWDVDQDWRELLREFCEKSYGPAADTMEKFLLAMAYRQSEAGQEAGTFYAYPLVYSQEFLDEMTGLLVKAEEQAENDIQRQRIQYMMIQPSRLSHYLNFWDAICEYRFEEAAALYDEMLETHREIREKNPTFGTQGAERFLGIHANAFLEGSRKYSEGDHRIVYRIPERLKTAMDRDSHGHKLRFFGRDINDDQYMKTHTYRSTWDAQGLAGYRKGSVWYRIPFQLEDVVEARGEDGQGVGLFIGGGEGVANVWLNERFIGQQQSYFARPNVFDLTEALDPEGENLLVIELNRVGNDDIGTGGLMFPSFLFAGPRIEAESRVDRLPFRVLPGGIVEYREDD